METREKIIDTLVALGFHEVDPKNIIPVKYHPGGISTHRQDPDEWYYDEIMECLWSAPSGKGGICLYRNGVYAEIGDNDFEEIEI